MGCLTRQLSYLLVRLPEYRKVHLGWWGGYDSARVIRTCLLSGCYWGQDFNKLIAPLAIIIDQGKEEREWEQGRYDGIVAELAGN
jgi:hypothetical protein